MDNPADDRPPGARQVARLLLPIFAASTLVMVIGVILALAHHRTAGFIVVAIGAVGGFVVRARIMIRSQVGRRPPY